MNDRFLSLLLAWALLLPLFAGGSIQAYGAGTVDQEKYFVTAKGENVSFLFDQDGGYEPGSLVTVTLMPERGYVLDLEALALTDEEGGELPFETGEPDEKGALVMTFEAAAANMQLMAAGKAQPTYEIRITTEALGQDPSILIGRTEEKVFYPGDEVKVFVEYRGNEIWTATATRDGGESALDITVLEEGIRFTMPDGAVDVTLSEREAQNLGDLSAADGGIQGDWQGNTSSTEKENEPDIALGKSARWTDIENGYAELTITEKDTSDYSNKPTDYIIILDRTRTMSLSQATWEQGGDERDIKNTNSPCINPDHYYQKGGISLHLKDYFTGYDKNTHFWFENLEDGAEGWTKRHYDASGRKISVSYSNGCQDRLSMAKQAIYELIDRIEANNADAPGGRKSRVAYWSFADGTNFGEQTVYRYNGLFNYTPWTEDYASVKRAVSQTKTFSGTYYTKSLEQVCQMIEERNRNGGGRANCYTKVIFISDGICGDGPTNNSSRAQVQALASQIKSMPNTELFTIAMGMPSDSEGARFLASLATQKPDGTYTASLWQNLSFSGDKNSALAQALFRIDSKGIEIKAAEKVLQDQIETKYWEAVEVLRADGGLSSVTLDKASGKISWRVPEGAGKTYSCTIKLRLKDAYRYLLSDTSYPTNRDEAGAASNPAKAGATMTYTIQGGIYSGDKRKTGIVTPRLKYGTVQLEGKKNWTVEGSQTEAVTVRLMRTLPSQTQALQVNNALTNAGRGWAYAFSVRSMPDGSTRPLIKYDEKGRVVHYEVTETVPAFYKTLGSIVSSGGPNQDGGRVVDSQLYNEPFKIKAQITKADAETGNLLSKAVFTVYAWSKKAGAYLPYKGKTDEASKPYETGTLNGLAEAMTLQEKTKGVYTTPAWLYYSPDNQGKFRVIETSAPKGYYGDWEPGKKITAASSDADKRVYDFHISPEAALNQATVILSNNGKNTFENQRVLGKLVFTKQDLEARESVSQGEAVLAGAVYRLYAGEDIIHQDGVTGILYKKDEEIKVRLTRSAQGVNTYCYDPAGTDVLTVEEGCKVVIEKLELGSYYLKEEKAGEGYLADPASYAFELAWQGEKLPVVELRDFPVYDQVKKQALSFYKVTGTDRADRLDPLEGAGFSIYLVSDLGGGKYRQVKDEDLPQALIDDYRNPTTLDYEAFRGLMPARIYAEADNPDVREGRLVKTLVYQDGTSVTVESDNENAYLAAELTSDSRGIVTTPRLPYGRYVVVETTTPPNVTATRPFVIRVEEDEEDGTIKGDGQGHRLEDLVILMDRPVNALVRIVKADSYSKKPVLKEGASYVIRDVEGAWFDYYTQEMTTGEKNAYRERAKGLVVQYSQGEYTGTREKPFVTRRVLSEENQQENVYIETLQGLPAGTYELLEISAPEGYVLQGHEGVIAKRASIARGNGTYYEKEETGKWEERSQGVTKFIVSSNEARYDQKMQAYLVTARQQNEPAVGKISIYAEGERLTGARQEGSTILTRLGDGLSWFFGYVQGLIGLDRADEEGMTEAELGEYQDYVFTYEKKPVEGAEFEIRAAEDLYSPEGGENAELLYEEGALVLTLTTDEEGKTWTGQEDWAGTNLAKGLPLGKYTVTQVKAGYGFALSRENAVPREVELAYAGQEVPVIYRDTSYENPRQKVRIAVTKKDRETEEALSGAVFGLYAAEDIQNDKGKTVVKKGTLVAIAETKASDKGEVLEAVFAPDLPLARYYIKELKAPWGYATGKEEITVDATYREDAREVLSLTGTIKNAPIRVQINLMDEFTEVELDGAQLTLLEEDGNPFTTFVSVHEGNPIIRGLEIGKTYILKELAGPKGYYRFLSLKEDYETKKEGIELPKSYTDEEKPEKGDIQFTVLDEEGLQVVSVFQRLVPGELVIEKTGEEAVGVTSTKDEAGNVLSVPIYEIRGLKGAEYALRAKEEISYPDGYTGTLFHEGELVLNLYGELFSEEGASLERGVYGLLKNYQPEIPEGYGELVDVREFLGVRHPKDASKEEVEAFYQEHGLEIERQLPSKEEIEANETRFCGTPADYILRTNEDGLIRLKGLPLGRYEVVEVKAPEGYYRDKTECIRELCLDLSEEQGKVLETKAEVKISYENAKQELSPMEPGSGNEIPSPDDGTTPEEDAIPEGGPIPLSTPEGLMITKYSADGERLRRQAGAAFTLYAAEDVRNLHGTLIYTKDQEIETAVSGKDGVAHFLTDVPIGRYKVRETKAPAGHYGSDKEMEFQVNRAMYNDNIHYLSFGDYVENAKTAVHIKLVDDMTKKELAGARLQVKDPAGNLKEAWVTETGDGYMLKGLDIDTEYTILEVLPRDGYLLGFTEAKLLSGDGVLKRKSSTELSLTIPGAVTKVTAEGRIDRNSIPETTRILLESPFVTGTARLSKEGEILTGWKLSDKFSAWTSSIFQYGGQGLKEVEFAVYAARDIYHPDGQTGLLFRKGDLADVNVRGVKRKALDKTDRLGSLSFEGMYLGAYEFREKTVPEGYVQLPQPVPFALTYVDGYTDPVFAGEGTVPIKNQRQKVTIEVKKLDCETKERLSGAWLGLFTEEDIKNTDGRVLVPKDTLLESKETNEGGLVLFESDLPLGYTYYIQELRAPEGYQKTQEKQTFTLRYAGAYTEVAKLSMAIENQKIPEEREGKELRKLTPSLTGDRLSSLAALWLLLLTAACAAIVRIVFRKKTRYNKTNRGE